MGNPGLSWGLHWLYRVFPELLQCMEYSPTKRMLFSTCFCRWDTEAQPDLVNIALSNSHILWLPAGLYARYYSSCSGRGFMPTAWHCNTNHLCEGLSQDAGIRGREAECSLKDLGSMKRQSVPERLVEGLKITAQHLSRATLSKL